MLGASIKRKTIFKGGFNWRTPITENDKKKLQCEFAIYKKHRHGMVKYLDLNNPYKRYRVVNCDIDNPRWDVNIKITIASLVKGFQETVNPKCVTCL